MHTCGGTRGAVLAGGLEREIFRNDGGRVAVGLRGKAFLDDIGLEDSTSDGRFCLDWSERRFHLAGPLAAIITHQLIDDRWFLRGAHREPVMTEKGRRGMKTWFSA